MTDRPDQAIHPRPPASDAVVFDIMRESLTVVMGDYVELARRADKAGHKDEADRIMSACAQVRDDVYNVNARDRNEQTAMTERLRALHAKLDHELSSYEPEGNES